jgi:hypothetical protein
MNSILQRALILEEYLAPFLVKEVRQILRIPTFTRRLICAHALLLASALLGSLQIALGIITFITCMIQPARVGTSCRSEFQSEFYDLLSLTRLSAWSLVTGKWLRGIIECLLIIASSFPYLLLAFHTGEIEYTSLLSFLLVLLCCLAAALAVSIAINVTQTKWRHNAGHSLITLMMVVVLLPYLFSGFLLHSHTNFDIQPITCLYFFLASLLITPLALLQAAGRIAPPHENYAIIQRLYAILAITMVVFVPLSPSYGGPLFVLICLAPLTVGLLACFEPTVYVQSRYARYENSPIRRTLGTPGWPSGLLYLTLVTVCYLLLLQSLVHLLPAGTGPFYRKNISGPGLLLSVLNVGVLPCALAAILRKQPTIFLFLLVHFGILLGSLAIFYFFEAGKNLSTSESQCILSSSSLSYWVLSLDNYKVSTLAQAIEFALAFPFCLIAIARHNTLVSRTYQPPQL